MIGFFFGLVDSCCWRLIWLGWLEIEAPLFSRGRSFFSLPRGWFEFDDLFRVTGCFSFRTHPLFGADGIVGAVASTGLFADVPIV